MGARAPTKGTGEGRASERPELPRPLIEPAEISIVFRPPSRPPRAGRKASALVWREGNTGLDVPGGWAWRRASHTGTRWKVPAGNLVVAWTDSRSATAEAVARQLFGGGAKASAGD